MKLTVKRADLLSVLMATSGAVESRTNIPVLSAQLIEAESAGIVVTASSMELFVRSDAAAEVTTPGRTAIDSRKLISHLKALSGEDVSIELKKTIAHIECGSVKARFRTMDAETFPAWPTRPDTGWEFVANLEAFNRAINIVKPIATACNGLVVGVAGAELASDGSNFTLAATDGHRLGVMGGTCSGRPGKVVLPLKLLEEIYRFPCPSLDLSLFVGERLIFASNGKSEVCSRRLDKTLSDWRRIESYKGDPILMCDSSTLRGAFLRSLNFLDPDPNKGRRVNVDLRADGISVSVAEQGAHEFGEHVSCNSSKEISFGLNARYASEALSAIGGDVGLFIKDVNSPLILTGKDGALCAMQPMR